MSLLPLNTFDSGRWASNFQKYMLCKSRPFLVMRRRYLAALKDLDEMKGQRM
jgi:hypothetical protein